MAEKVWPILRKAKPSLLKQHREIIERWMKAIDLDWDNDLMIISPTRPEKDDERLED